MDDNPPKSQAIERLKEAQNVLITVNNNPSVDQLAAAVGFTLLMNKLGKHATAVFSGKIPSTIEFLKPEDTLEQNTDSLRDFIIALDKSKADKLRYKVEENVVKIFITPYKTSLNEKDLDFSQGDYNVDVVIALGVDQKEHIDQAIVNHGRILHDATVIGVMAGTNNLDLGSINWQDPNASSLCEMLVSISEAFQSGLLDAQMSTAFLTGIVSETNRFSNEKTTPKVMTMAAQLMAAGANQQLISTELTLPAEKLYDPTELVVPKDNIPTTDEGEISLREEQVPEEVANLPAPSEIDIDKHGTYKTAEEIIAEMNASKKDKKDDQVYSEYITEPPKDSGVLTANANPEVLEKSVDPLSAPIIAEDYPDQNGKGKDIKPLEDFGLDKPLGPQVTTDETLDQIEKDVNSFETYSNPPTDAMPDPDQARQAINEAVDKYVNPDRPEPQQAMGSTEFMPNNQELHNPLVPDESYIAEDSQAPPTPPPMLVPPFPETPKDKNGLVIPHQEFSTLPKEDNNDTSIPPMPNIL